LKSIFILTWLFPLLLLAGEHTVTLSKYTLPHSPVPSSITSISKHPSSIGYFVIDNGDLFHATANSYKAYPLPESTDLRDSELIQVDSTLYIIGKSGVYEFSFNGCQNESCFKPIYDKSALALIDFDQHVIVLGVDEILVFNQGSQTPVFTFKKEVDLESWFFQYKGRLYFKSIQGVKEIRIEQGAWRVVDERPQIPTSYIKEVEQVDGYTILLVDGDALNLLIIDPNGREYEINQHHLNHLKINPLNTIAVINNQMIVMNDELAMIDIPTGTVTYQTALSSFSDVPDILGYAQRGVKVGNSDYLVTLKNGGLWLLNYTQTPFISRIELPEAIHPVKNAQYDAHGALEIMGEGLWHSENKTHLFKDRTIFQKEMAGGRTWIYSQEGIIETLPQSEAIVAQITPLDFRGFYNKYLNRSIATTSQSRCVFEAMDTYSLQCVDKNKPPRRSYEENDILPGAIRKNVWKYNKQLYQLANDQVLYINYNYGLFYIQAKNEPVLDRMMSFEEMTGAKGTRLRRVEKIGDELIMQFVNGAFITYHLVTHEIKQLSDIQPQVLCLSKLNDTYVFLDLNYRIAKLTDAGHWQTVSRPIVDPQKGAHFNQCESNGALWSVVTDSEVIQIDRLPLSLEATNQLGININQQGIVLINEKSALIEIQSDEVTVEIIMEPDLLSRAFDWHYKVNQDPWKPFTSDIKLNDISFGETNIKVSCKDLLGNVACHHVIRLNYPAPFYLSLYAFISYLILLLVVLVFSVRVFIKKRDLWLAKLRHDYMKQLSSKLVHDVTKGLVAIQHSTEKLEAAVLKKDGVDTDLNRRTELNRINSHIMFMRQIMQNIGFYFGDEFDIKQKTSESVRMIEILEFINKLKMLITGQSRDIEFRVEANIAHDSVLLMERATYQHALLNIVNNSGLYTKTGRIVINLSIRETSGQAELVTSVADTGVGISKVMLDELKHNMEQLKSSDATESSGLGLLCIQKEMNRVKGRIDIESTLGAGTKVTFSMPVIISKERAIQDQIILGRPLRVAVVDDTLSSIQAINAWMKARGHTVFPFLTAEEFLEELRSGEEFDVHILDYHLSDDLLDENTGLHLKKAIDALGISKPTALWSGTVNFASKSEEIAQHFDLVVDKMTKEPIINFVQHYSLLKS
jgi:signal transduction histidine kinase